MNEFVRRFGVDPSAVAHEWGWKAANAGELRVIRALRVWHVDPSAVEQQFKLGPYRLDFAFVRERLALEADGYPHTTTEGKRRDRVRDRKLADWGWRVCRIDVTDEAEEQAIERSVHDALALRAMPR